MRERPAAATRPGFFANPVWPLAVPFVGLPIWWILGLWQIMFFLMAIPMFVYLVRQRTIAMPRGFWIWLLWMAWLLTGVLVMQVDAPGTIPGVNMNRYIVFGYRYGWYLIATVVVLYVVNTRHVLSTKKVLEAVSWFFVVLVGGGLLGLLAPEISFDSVFQSLLPHSLASHSLVNELMHVQTAQMHSVLGDPQPRPSAPFIYTNGWGFATAITLPLFVAAWWGRGGRWRVGMAIVLVFSLVPIILSLNRGTWIAILASILLAVVHSAMHGKVKVLVAAAGATCLAIALVLFSPLGDMVMARIENGHSDEGRENLVGMALQSTIEGSPVVGFGTTRNVAGNFSSIAGGASDACPNCEPPPVGTHGQIWLATFGAGFVGMVLYVGFMLRQFLGNLRTRSPYALAALASVLTLLVTLPIYNAIGVPLYIGFIAIGVLARECTLPLPSLQESVRPLLRNAPAFTLCVGLGALAGYGVNSALGVPVTATQQVLVPAAELAPVPGIRSSTLDAEAVLARSEPVVAAVVQELGVPASEVHDGLSVGAEPNTRVLVITYQASDVDDARRGVETAVDAFIEERARFLSSNAVAVTQRYVTRQVELDAIYRSTRPYAEIARSQHLWSTITELSRQWTHASNILSDMEVPPQAQVISSADISLLNDYRTVRVASGIGLGGLLGLPLILLYDRRHRRLGTQPERHTGLGVPVVARCAAEDLGKAVSAADGYMPLAGVIADAESPRATRLASRIDDELAAADYAGSRTLVIVDPRTRAYRAQRMVERMRQGGLDPVGLIVCEPRHARFRSRMRAKGDRS